MCIPIPRTFSSKVTPSIPNSFCGFLNRIFCVIIKSLFSGAQSVFNSDITTVENGFASISKSINSSPELVNIQ